MQTLLETFEVQLMERIRLQMKSNSLFSSLYNIAKPHRCPWCKLVLVRVINPLKTDLQRAAVGWQCLHDPV